MQKLRTYVLQLFLFASFLLFWWKGAENYDPDFGWHVRVGELILSHGIPFTDPFSYTMPSYPFVAHEWLTDVLIFLLMQTVTYSGLAFIFSLLTVTAFTLPLVILSATARKYLWIPLILTFVLLIPFEGVRPQVLTWFFFSLLLFVIRDKTLFQKWFFVIPFLFLLWANLHGGFAIGIAVLFLATCYWAYQLPSKKYSFFGIFFLSILATFVMPYGYGSWWEIWMTVSDNSLRWQIREWMPTFLTPSLPMSTYLILSVVFVARYRRKFNLLDLTLYFGLLIATISSVRHLPLWLLVALPLTSQSLLSFREDVAKIPQGLHRLRIATKILLVIIVIVCLQSAQSFFFGVKPYSYPAKAIGYLKTYQPRGQLFVPYQWGGYLIWQYPEKKVFIDGRMPSWRRTTISPDESSNAFQEYNHFLEGKVAFNSIVDKYTISTLLLPHENQNIKNIFWQWADAVIRNTLGSSLPQESAYDHIIAEAKKDGWKIVYQDKGVVIYQDTSLEKR